MRHGSLKALWDAAAQRSTVRAVRQVLVALGGGHLVYIEIGQAALQEVSHVSMGPENEISCLARATAASAPQPVLRAR